MWPLKVYLYSLDKFYNKVSDIIWDKEIILKNLTCHQKIKYNGNICRNYHVFLSYDNAMELQ